MVQQRTVFIVVAGGAAGDLYDRDSLGISAGHAVDGAQLADDIGREQSAQAAGACVGIGGVSRVELVAGAYAADAALLHRVEHAQHKVAGNAEDVLDAQFLEAVHHIVTDGVLGHAERSLSAAH